MLHVHHALLVSAEPLRPKLRAAYMSRRVSLRMLFFPGRR